MPSEERGMTHTEVTTTFAVILLWFAFILIAPGPVRSLIWWTPRERYIPCLQIRSRRDAGRKIPPAKVHGGHKTVSPAPGTAPLRDTLACDHGGIRPRLLARAFSGKLRGHLRLASRTGSQPLPGSL